MRILFALLVLGWGCDDSPQTVGDTSLPDQSVADAQPMDMARPDVGQKDARAPDVGPVDGAVPDVQPDMLMLPGDQVRVRVLLNGDPAPDTVVIQGGTTIQAVTDANGEAILTLDRTIEGQIMVVASHQQARMWAAEVPLGIHQVEIALTRFSSDNRDYVFQDPGEPERRPNTGQCAHCHQTINESWFNSPHRSSARNSVVQDLYAGTAQYTAETCAGAGGRWLPARRPGGGEGSRCFLGDGLLPTVNPECADGPCPTPEIVGQCASCHAPGMNGDLGGRDLLAAKGYAYEYGVHCDVCHRVESIDPEGGPGVAGRLRLHRPGEFGPPTLGKFLPLTFGPSHDSPNPRMGGVQRDLFRDGSICSGCHQLDAEPYVEGIDRARWPDGRLPIQSTYEEWKTGALAEATRCPSCHMPPDALASNGGDLQLFPLADLGVQGGWKRPAGSVRKHSWVGPRQPESKMLELAAMILVKHRQQDGVLLAEVTVKNVSAGHAIPTGEPMRQLLLTVEAYCEDTVQPATGGDVLPAWAGSVAQQDAQGDWSQWPKAQIGDQIRVIRRPGGFIDYTGFGPFGDRFNAEEKGRPIEHFVGVSQVIGVQDGQIQLDRPLPVGDHAYLVRETRSAGAPGFAFARVLTDARGREMVPHMIATDVRSDNRLMPQAEWTSQHQFAAECANPTITARLAYRAYPDWLARERGWRNPDRVIAEVRR